MGCFILKYGPMSLQILTILKNILFWNMSSFQFMINLEH